MESGETEGNMRFLDKQLWEEFDKPSLNENIIYDLLGKGANINSVNDIGDNLLINCIFHDSDINIIKIIIELGININYADEGGFNCLFFAYLTNRSDLVELLLEKGAEPQYLSMESFETLLDWIETNRWFHIEVEKDVDINWINNDEKIINLLKAYGAKSIFDHAESIDDYLIITGYIDSGLYTKYGYLNINEINNIDENTITIFKEWLSRIVDISKDIGNGIFDDRDLLEKTNNEGIIITEKLRNIIENNAITVKYNYIKMDSGYRKEVIIEKNNI